MRPSLWLAGMVGSLLIHSGLIAVYLNQPVPTGPPEQALPHGTPELAILSLPVRKAWSPRPEPVALMPVVAAERDASNISHNTTPVLSVDKGHRNSAPVIGALGRARAIAPPEIRLSEQPIAIDATIAQDAQALRKDEAFYSVASPSPASISGVALPSYQPEAVRAPPTTEEVPEVQAIAQQEGVINPISARAAYRPETERAEKPLNPERPKETVLGAAVTPLRPLAPQVFSDRSILSTDPPARLVPEETAFRAVPTSSSVLAQVVSHVDHKEPHVTAVAPQARIVDVATGAVLGDQIVTDRRSLLTLGAFDGDQHAIAALQQNLEAIEAGIPCTRVTLRLEDDHLRLGGHVPNTAMTDPLRTLVSQQVGQQIRLADDVKHVPPPACTAIDTLISLGLTPFATDDAGIGRKAAPIATKDIPDEWRSAPTLLISRFDQRGQVFHNEDAGSLPPSGVLVIFHADGPILPDSHPARETATEFLTYIEDRVGAFDLEWTYIVLQ